MGSFRDTPVYRYLYSLCLEYNDDLSPKYSITDITKKLKAKFKADPKFDKLNVSTVKRWIDKYEIGKAKEEIATSAIEQAVTEKKTVEEKLEVIEQAKIGDLKEKYKSLDNIFKQSQFLLNRILNLKIKELEDFLKYDRTVEEISDFLRSLSLSERDLSIVNSKAFECLQKLNPESDDKKKFETFFEAFNNAFGNI